MKQNIILTLLILLTNITFAQTYNSLQKLEGVGSNVYYSENAKERAVKISSNVSKAEFYFQKEFKTVL